MADGQDNRFIYRISGNAYTVQGGNRMNNMGEMLLDHYQKYLGNSLAPNHIATMNIKFNCWALTKQ